VNYANETSQAAIQQSSQDAYDVTRLTHTKAAMWTVDDMPHLINFLNVIYLLFRPHHMCVAYRCGLLQQTCGVSVGRSVCVHNKEVPCKSGWTIKMPFGVWGGVGRSNHVLDGCPDPAHGKGQLWGTRPWPQGSSRTDAVSLALASSPWSWPWRLGLGNKVLPLFVLL